VKIKEFLLLFLAISFHYYSQACCMVSYFPLVNVFQVVSTIFSPVTVSILKLQLNRRSFTGALVVLACWLFDGSFPWFNSHKLVPFIVLYIEIISLFGLLNYFFFSCSWDSNLIIVIIVFLIFILVIAWLLNITTVLLIFLIFFLLLFFHFWLIQFFLYYLTSSKFP